MIVAALVWMALRSWKRSTVAAETETSASVENQKPLTEVEVDFLLCANANNPLLWVRLGNQLLPVFRPAAPLTEENSMMVLGKRRSAMDCAVEAILLHNRVAGAWLLLGITMSLSGWRTETTINRITYSPQKCFEIALSIDSHLGVAWDHLARLLVEMDVELRNVSPVTATIQKKSHSVAACVRRALQHSVVWPKGWLYLALRWSEGGGDAAGSIGGVSTLLECTVMALNFSENQTNAALWRQLGELLLRRKDKDLNVCHIGDVEVDAVQALIEALRIEPQVAPVWDLLAEVIEADPRVQGCSRQARLGCYEEALKYNQKDGVAWNQVGCNLLPTDIIMLNGSPYTQKDCFINAVIHLSDKQRDVAWKNLGRIMRDAEAASRQSQRSASTQLSSLGSHQFVAEVSGVQYTWQQCLANGGESVSDSN